MQLEVLWLGAQKSVVNLDLVALSELFISLLKMKYFAALTGILGVLVSPIGTDYEMTSLVSHVIGHN